MGCVSSDRKDPSQKHREKMLLLYMRGIDSRPLREINVDPYSNGRIDDVPSSLKVGDDFVASDGGQFKFLCIENNEKIVFCMSCNVKITEDEITKHLNSIPHINSI